MPHLPHGLITIAARRTTSYFAPYALRITLWRDTELLDQLDFYGSNGHTTRKHAMIWAEETAERFAHQYKTAWRSHRDSKLAWHHGVTTAGSGITQGDRHAIARFNANNQHSRPI